MADLSHIDHWIFDLDNTLYEAHCQLFKQIDARMTAFISEKFSSPHDEARKLQKHYYAVYGTTLNGLMNEHGVCPNEFMAFVHDIDVSAVEECPRLISALEKLPGKKYIFTNGSVAHAENVCNARGITHFFDDVFDIKAAGYTPKPHKPAYDAFFTRHAIDPARTAMFEDLAQNLEHPHALGMTTVLICADAPWFDDEPAAKRPASPGARAAHVDYATENLAGFLHDAHLTDDEKPA